MNIVYLWAAIVLLGAYPSSTSKDAAELIFLDTTQGDFAKSLSEYEVVYPTRIHVAKRSRRSSEPTFTDDLNKKYYKLKAFGEELLLELQQNTKLLTPQVILDRGLSGSRPDSDQHCFYTGSVASKPDSLVSLSTCKGLEGLIRVNHSHDMFVEPVRGYESQDDQRPHLVYQKSVVPRLLSSRHQGQALQHNTNCGVPEHEQNKHADSNRDTMPYRYKSASPRYYDSFNVVNKSRRRRSTSTEKYVETMVVADASMVQYYNRSRIDLEHYLLTVLNMVSSLYHDSSIGQPINIVLVKVLLLNKNPERLSITHHADASLESFCNWASSINPADDDHPHHHDVAILITRTDICRGMNEPCGTLGLSKVNGMCLKSKSCNINEDTGLSLAYTIAHELGHNFGIQHDGTNNECQYDSSDQRFIMSPSLTPSSHPFIWSTCSRHYLFIFLYRGFGFCLNDEPSPHVYFTRKPDRLPGQEYTLEEQCRLAYGSHASYCDVVLDPCGTLWCKLNDTCHSRLEAAADGTPCGSQKWCWHGACVPKHNLPEVIDGAWGSWSEWSSCSRTCGVGLQYRERHCDSPKPHNGGRYCIGEFKLYSVCNSQDCSPLSPSYRQLQCSEFDHVPFKNGFHTWKETYLPDRPCELWCVSKLERRAPRRLAEQVRDGTLCKPGSNNVCVNGLCENVGCDWVIHSTAKEDHCGVCRGNGSTCKTIKEQYKLDHVTYGYVNTALIPAGARNIRVEELVSVQNNYLAVRSQNGQYQLNGDWLIQLDGVYNIAGTRVHYSRDEYRDMLRAHGPTNETIYIMTLVQEQTPGIEIEYTVPNNSTSTLSGGKFDWTYGDWSQCSARCGEGSQRSEPECKDMDGGYIVDDSYCESIRKPPLRQRVCNMFACPPRWWTGPWQECSRSCDMGFSLRAVFCIRSINPDQQVALPDSDCALAGQKPYIRRACTIRLCPGRWLTSDWSECSALCGQGVQTRNVTCSDNFSCGVSPKPSTMQSCSGSSCAKWIAGDWGPCSVTCGTGVQRRQVECSNQLDASLCIGPPQEREQACTMPECASWFTKEWSECSRPCGLGTRTRRVICVGSGDSLKPMEVCDQQSRPPEKEACNPEPCANWTIGSWGECSAVCGVGVQTREVDCLQTQSCTASEHNENERRCEVSCSWVPGPWGECSASCNGGVQQRTLTCRRMGSVVDNRFCPAEFRPELVAPCNQNIPCVRDTSLLARSCVEDATYCCTTVPRHWCKSTYFRQKCCRMCMDSSICDDSSRRRSGGPRLTRSLLV